MQHVAKISCRNGVDGEYWEEKEILEEKSATYCKNLLQKRC